MADETVLTTPAASSAAPATPPASNSAGETPGAQQPETPATAPQAANPAASPAVNPSTPPASPVAEDYELTSPSDFPMDETSLKNLNAMCKDAKLSKAQGEAVLRYMAGNYTAWQEQQLQTRQDWLAEFRADKTFGGDKYDASVAEARKALATFDEDGKIRGLLESSGYGDNPDVLRIFARVGRALGEDKLVRGDAGASNRSLEDRFYPNM